MIRVLLGDGSNSLANTLNASSTKRRRHDKQAALPSLFLAKSARMQTHPGTKG
jgi:hypothetical protein